jgi:predicted DNA-binding transcriptional regulator AlpA
MSDSPTNSQSDDNPLLAAKEVSAWLGVSEDWVWDHSTRRAPFLPAIWLSNGALRFRPSAIRGFINERERISSLRRKRRKQSF